MFAVMVISSISAEILISQPKAIYALGNELSSEITIGAIEQGYMDVNLICSGETISLYHDVPDSNKITINRQLTPLYIGNLIGNCHLEALYNSKTKQSQNFEISNLIQISLSNTNLITEAGKNIGISGFAYRKNNEPVGKEQLGFIEIKITGNENFSEIISSQVVQNGKLDINFTIPETTKKGDYPVQIKVYDVDSQNNILNSEEITSTIKVLQKPAKIEIAVDKTIINPGENISLIPFVYDFSGDEYDGEVLVKIENSNKESLFEGYASANAPLTIVTQTNLVQGDARIRTQTGEIFSEKYVTINQLEKIDMEIKNNTLTVTNVGNVPYHKIVEVKIGEQTILKQIDLELGQKKVYQINGPEGNYEISIIDGKESSYAASGVTLEGGVIGISEVRGVSSFLVKYPIVWIFVILVIGFLAWVIYEKKRVRNGFMSPVEKKPYAGREFRKSNIQEIRQDRGVVIQKNKFMPSREVRIHGDITQAEPSSSIHGHKQNSGVIAIKVKNILKGIAEDNLNKSLELAYKKKGASFVSGSYIILLFSPLLTRTYKNEEIAVKAALSIDDFIKDHNRKFRNDKIEYGIGVSSGDIINKIENEKLMFTTIDKTLVSAKKVAEVSSNEVLLSAEIRSKVANSIKTDKADIPGSNVEAFRIKRVVNNEDSEKFIQSFMRRNSTK